MTPFENVRSSVPTVCSATVWPAVGASSTSTYGAFSAWPTTVIAPGLPFCSPVARSVAVHDLSRAVIVMLPVETTGIVRK